MLNKYLLILFSALAYAQVDPYNVGDIGPAGGVIFYEKADWTDGWKYLEAPRKNWSGTATDPVIAFGNSTPIRTYEAIGTGDANTYATSDGGNNFNNVFYNRQIGGKRGWYLPSMEEARALYNFKQSYGNDFLELESTYYHTSSTETGNQNIVYTFHMGNVTRSYT